MTVYDVFETEKNQIDQLLHSGFKMTRITSNLDGDVVHMERIETNEQRTIRLTNPESRKYLTTLLIRQGREGTIT
ncbi:MULTISPECIES: hypothetical protein [Virgibacillus]|uniref:Uncharacterized protein n=1 Tax=Virgibacillus massiliensis TaxID=1462526 RepID=A0A024QFM0_9BACI|nr:MULTISPECIES: hypothetical protein [Virgibacillus]EQB38844.1 hypothetical protein M948_00445 [Virgibacillus sp. CM-4]MYL43212.1 hypothetical protein [Virgibacillus massiliensis]CDQ40970.1 hypothetical protein BN990_03319 [Virgibacillus massiliensis]